MKLFPDFAGGYGDVPAAFRRLCVETDLAKKVDKEWAQPPSGGCVLKPLALIIEMADIIQPPSGGCVLKL